MLTLRFQVAQVFNTRVGGEQRLTSASTVEGGREMQEGRRATRRREVERSRALSLGQASLLGRADLADFHGAAPGEIHPATAFTLNEHGGFPPPW